MTALLVLTNLPNRPPAEALATELVDARLAACLSIMAPFPPPYRWQGVAETADEIPLLIKTPSERYADLEAAIRGRHPYDLPEPIALPIVGGLPDYLAWVASETRGTG